jgi:hypothetical protein
MTQTTFPFLTLDNVASVGASWLKTAATWFPSAGPELLALATMLPLLAHIPVLEQAAQHLINEINKITGAIPSS